MPVLGLMPSPIRAPAKGWAPSWAPTDSPRSAPTPPPPSWPPGGTAPPGWSGLPAAVPAAGAAPLGLFAAGGLAFVGGALLNWAYQNSRSKGRQDPGMVGGTEFIVSGFYSIAGNTLVTYYGEGAEGATVLFSGCDPETPQPVTHHGGSWVVNRLCGFEVADASGSQCGSADHRLSYKQPNQFNPNCVGSGITGKLATTGFNGYLKKLPRAVITLSPVTPNPTDGPATDLVPMPAPVPGPPVPLRPVPEPEPLREAEPAGPSPLRPPIAPPIPAGDPLPPSPAVDPDSVPAPFAPSPGFGTETGRVPELLPLPRPVLIPGPAPFDPTAPQVDDGEVTFLPQRPPVTVTEPGTEVTPDGVIGQPGTAPPPTLIGIAAEVGKIEQKTLQLLNRPRPEFDASEILDPIQEILDALQSMYGPGSYTLAPSCEEGGAAVADWPGGSGEFGQVNRKLDALAELLQAHKDQRQPICHVRAIGQELTVDFIEDRAGTWEDRPLRKTLSYRDQGGGSLESHTAGWTGFSWQAGPVQLKSVGSWGHVQVYASSAGEAERVIRHAAGLAGYDLDNDPDHRWRECLHSGGRIGRSATMITRPVTGGIAVRWRNGASGPSYTAVNMP